MITQREVKYIIFDFGGVLMNLGGKHTGNPINLAKIFSISEEKAEEIWKENKENVLTGEETPKEFLIKIKNNLNSFVNVAEAYELWEELDRIKKDQRTGKLTHGIVAEILTSSASHHRGIKVRLKDGQVGRIQKIYPVFSKINGQEYQEGLT